MIAAFPAGIGHTLYSLMESVDPAKSASAF
jgi:hypothetical protein